MEFNEKLQQLRKERNLTQEELAEMLFVSRTAVSKWESGRGLPSIDSLKGISKVFSVSIDDLLSGEKVIEAAEQDKRDKNISIRNVIYGLLDIMIVIFFFIPIFGERREDYIESVSLFNMKQILPYMLVTYIIIITLPVVFGVIELVLQNFKNKFWNKYASYISMIITIIGTLLFIASQEPYAATFMFWILIIKGYMYLKQR